tara:strand:+ start:2265 stop:2492 length:228 start_codon:yes stop_codon:yes gene_type:complete
MEKKLESVFKKIFPKFKGKFNDKVSPKNLEDWDSLNHLNLMTAVSKKFKINFEFKEIIAINNIGELKKRIKKKIV